MQLVVRHLSHVYWGSGFDPHYWQGMVAPIKEPVKNIGIDRDFFNTMKDNVYTLFPLCLTLNQRCKQLSKRRYKNQSSKSSWLADYMVVHPESPRESIMKLPRTKNSAGAEYEITIQQLTTFILTDSKQLKNIMVK